MSHWQRTFKTRNARCSKEERIGRDNGVCRKEGRKSVCVCGCVWVGTLAVEFWENSDGGLAVSGVNL